MILSIYKDNLEFAEILCDLGADVDATDTIGNTALMGASFKGNIKAIELLLRYNAKYNLKNASGIDAYGWARLFKRENVINYYKEKFNSNSDNNIFKLYLKMFILLILKIIKKGK